MPKHVLGAQMYTLHDFLKTPADIAEALKKVAAIGYKTVQLSGLGPIDPKELAAMLEDTGLRAVATHVAWDRFKDDLDAVIAEHKLWNCPNAAIGSLPLEYRSLDGLDRFIEEVTPISEKLTAEGLTFSYHNHSHELVKYNGKTWLEQLYEKAPPDILKAEIDVYWIQHGGGDPTAWVRKCAGREPLLHLKDMAITMEREQRYAEIGEGNLNWKSILAAAEEAGVEWYLVEQDSCYDRDAFESLAISYRNLTEMGLS